MYTVFHLIFMTACDKSPTKVLVQVTKQTKENFTAATLQRFPYRIISGGAINRCWDESREYDIPKRKSSHAPPTFPPSCMPSRISHNGPSPLDGSL